MIQTDRVRVQTAGDCDVVDITHMVVECVRASNIVDGIVTIFVPGSTAALTTMEYEPGLVRDTKELFNRIVPAQGFYEHDARWGDGNGYSHVRASLVGPALTIPLSMGQLLLGTWQQIVLLDMDNRPRAREIVVQTIGE